MRNEVFAARQRAWLETDTADLTAIQPVAESSAQAAEPVFTVSWGDTGFALSGANLAALTSAGMVAAETNFDKLQFGLGDLFVESSLSTIGLSDAARTAALVDFQSANTLAPIVAGHVAIDAIAVDGNGAALLAALNALGFQGGVAYNGLVGGYIPLDKIDDLAALSGLAFARPAYSTTNAINVPVGAGSVVSQDTYSVNAGVLQTEYGLTGAGQKIGFLSDSFNTATTTTGGAPLTVRYADDIASGDLPAGVQILLEGTGLDEGRAMAQLAYDIAPGAALAFHTANGGQAVFAAGIAALAAAGSNIIVDDIIYYAEPMFQDGIIAQAVDTVTAGGVQYFSSAGNQAQSSYAATFVDSGQTFVRTVGAVTTTYRLHDFDPGVGVDSTQTFTQSGSVIYDFQWADVYHSVVAAGGAASDLALIFRTAAGAVIAVVDTNNIGGDPIELSQLNGNGSFTISLGVKSTTPDPTFVKYVWFGTGTANEYATASSTSFGHNNAAGANAVAAANFFNTPAYGATPLGEQFTSRGGTPILFDTAGNRLAEPEIRRSSDFTAADGGNNTFFGGDTSGDPDTLPNFYGTSAAAPVAAALAALLHEAAPNATNTEIEDALTSTALDILGLAAGRPTTVVGVVTGPGYDRDTGFGLIQGDAALEALIGPRATAVAETTQVRENVTVSGNLLTNDIVASGGQPAAIRAVNGELVEFGTPITLLSGALLTVNSNGTYTYDPNHKFDYLIRNVLAQQLGAVNGIATDTFTYSLVGGSTATVSIAVRGLESAGDQLRGDGNNNAINGTVNSNLFNLAQGGIDTANGLGGNDTFYFGGTLTAADRIDGGIDTDIVLLQGEYSGGLTFDAASLTSVERINVLSGSDTSFGDLAGNSYDYVITTVDGNVASGQRLTIDAKDLTATESLTVDGSAELDGIFALRGGEGADVLVGGHGNDQLGGRGGADIFGFFEGSGEDVITDFTSGSDKIDLSTLGFETFQQVINAATDVGGNTVIDLGGNDSATLRGVTKAQLQSDDFIYATPAPLFATSGGSSAASLAWDDDLFFGQMAPAMGGTALSSGDFDGFGALDGLADQGIYGLFGLQHHDFNLV